MFTPLGAAVVVALSTAPVVGALWAPVVGALWAPAPNPPFGANPPSGAVAFWSVFISAIALPHVAVGAVLDRERGVWHVS